MGLPTYMMSHVPRTHPMQCTPLKAAMRMLHQTRRPSTLNQGRRILLLRGDMPCRHHHQVPRRLHRHCTTLWPLWAGYVGGVGCHVHTTHLHTIHVHHHHLYRAGCRGCKPAGVVVHSDLLCIQGGRGGLHAGHAPVGERALDGCGDAGIDVDTGEQGAHGCSAWPWTHAVVIMMFFFTVLLSLTSILSVYL